MNNSKTLLTFFVAIAAMLLFGNVQAADRPNIIVILTDDLAERPQGIPNPGFEAGDKAPTSWAPTEWRSAWAMVPGEQGRGRCLRLEGSGKSPVWRSAAFPLDARRDYTLSAQLRTQQLQGNRAEVYLEAINADGKFLKRQGKGWPTYRVSAGVSARESKQWHEVSASVRHQDIPQETTQARAVCCVEMVAPCDGYALFDDLACQPETVTSDFQLLQDSAVAPGNLGLRDKPVMFVFDIYAPELANQTIAAGIEVQGYFGVSLREQQVQISLDNSGVAKVEMDLKPFSRTGWFEVYLRDESNSVLCHSAFGMVDPALPTSDVEPASPYGVGRVYEEDREIARRAGIKAVRHGWFRGEKDKQNYLGPSPAWYGMDLGVVPHGKGRYVLSALRIVENLDADPVADKILFNMIEWTTKPR